MIKSKETICRDKCKTCKYRTTYLGIIGCYYIVITGKIRKSSPEKCNEYEKGEPEKNTSTDALYKNKFEDGESFIDN